MIETLAIQTFEPLRQAELSQLPEFSSSCTFPNFAIAELGVFPLSSVKSSRCNVARVAQSDFVAVAATRGPGRVAGACLRRDNCLMSVTVPRFSIFKNKS